MVITGSNGAHAKAPFDPMAWLRREWATALGFALAAVICAHYVYFVITAEQQKQREAAFATRQAQFTACQARYNRAVSAQIVARAAAADDASAADRADALATRNLLTGVGQLVAAPERDQAAAAARYRRLFTEYRGASARAVTAKAKADAARAAHPLPEFPVC